MAQRKGGVPQGQRATEDWWGKGEPTHSQSGGLGSHMWRQNMRGLKDHLFGEEYPMAEFMEDLSNHVQSLTQVPKGQWESHRSYLSRTKESLSSARGLSFLDGLENGLDSPHVSWAG